MATPVYGFSSAHERWQLGTMSPEEPALVWRLLLSSPLGPTPPTLREAPAVSGAGPAPESLVLTAEFAAGHAAVERFLTVAAAALPADDTAALDLIATTRAQLCLAADCGVRWLITTPAPTSGPDSLEQQAASLLAALGSTSVHPALSHLWPWRRMSDSPTTAPSAPSAAQLLAAAGLGGVTLTALSGSRPAVVPV